ncbi:NifU family protein [Sulfurovum sp. XGS-02]|uniref:NifU family protein n=1 Tax=Sulfurovum sp. XGS-02 TaxID=2925411 RepID=UPI00205733E2|nr:NifU family protein [Sulfurovum sp. XGS-02]UPT78494.1 NifU family protein [Sulfurovum sp. XGS-02]
MDQVTNDEYGIKVAMFINEPKYLGTISEEEAKELGASLFSYTYGDEALGYKLTIHWAVNTHEDRIVLARYTYDGIASGIAVNHMLALVCTNKSIPQINDITYKGLERLLRDNPTIEALPSSERYTITFALDTVKLAVKEYIHAPLNHEEKTVPCKDSPMSIASIKESIELHNIDTLECLVEYTKAGSMDTDCKENLLAYIEEHQKLLEEEEEAEKALAAIPFRELNPEYRIMAVETAIDNTVRQFLIMDGGDIDVLNVKENGEIFEVYISYLGACSDCSSSGTGTLQAIQNALRDKLDPNIYVIAI